MKNLKTLAILLLATISSLGISAQKRKKNKFQKEGEIKVITIKDDNGNVTKTEDVFNLSDKKELEKMLKEKGIELNLDEAVGTSVKVDGKNSNNKKVIVKTVTTTKTTTTDGKKGPDRIKMVNITNGEVTHSDEDVDVIIEEIGGGKGQRITVSSKDDEFPSREIIVDAVGNVSDDATTMVFVRKQTKDVTRTDLPNSINQIFDGDATLKDLNLFPNPTNGNFKMEFTSNVPQNFNLSITGVKGAQVFEKILLDFEGKYSEDFDLSKYESGIYFFNLNSKGQTVSKKIVVQ